MTQRVLITGGSRGIGKITATLVQAHGWEVITPTRAECDLRHWRSLEEYCAAMPTCHGMILNAHEWYAQPLKDQDACDFEFQYNYVIAHWMLLRYALLQGEVTSVVGVSSTRGLIGGVASAPYSMAKAAMIAMMQGFAREYHGVRFNCVAPGLSATDMEYAVRETGGCAADAVAQPPESVASLIIDLLEDTTANGQVWRINASKRDRMQWGIL